MLLTGITLSHAATYTYRDILLRLTDLENLAVLPDAGEKCALASSYDRASRYDSVTQQYVNWYANTGDGTGYIRAENGKQVLAEMMGPGVLWRIQSAQLESGHVLIYLDSSATPAADLPFSGYFDHSNQPFNRSALVHTVARGNNCYVPIPYQKSCKVSADPTWGMFYHFTYTTFPAGTIVPTFSRSLSPADSALLDSIDQVLGNCGRDPAGSRPGQTTDTRNLKIVKGDSISLLQLAGEGAITVVRVRFITPPSIYDMRALSLAMFWDGESSPSVWAPLGDFFGTAPGYNKFRSLPSGVTDSGCYSFWYMPFRNGAKISLKNDGNNACSLQVSITHAPLTKPIAQLGRFHAKWHRDAFIPADPNRANDWTMLTTTGRGRFCGASLHVWNTSNTWWGEGDEKFFVDGEKFPSSHGTARRIISVIPGAVRNTLNPPSMISR